MALEVALNEWRALLGAEQVLPGDQVLAKWGRDTGGNERQVPAVLSLADASLIPGVLDVARRHAVPVYPISTGHNWGYGTALPARDGCVLLDLGRMNRIVDFDAELGVVTVEPGVTQGMLADFLDQGGHPFLVPVTGAGPSCSLLSNALERGYGVTPHVDHFGAVTDIEAVLADGSLYRTALREAGNEKLAKLFKWGIGPYSVGLFTQSGLGIVTRMSIILARKPECVKVCLFSLQRDDLLEPAVLKIREVLGKLPQTIGALNLMNQHRVLSMSAPYPAGQIGADGLIPADVIAKLGRQYQIFAWTGFCTLYGTRRMVAAAQKEVRAALGGIASRMMFLTPDRAKTLAGLTKVIPGKFGEGLQGMTATLAKSLELVAGRPNETALPLAYWRNPQPPKGPNRDPGVDGCGLLWYAPLVPMRPADIRTYVNMVHEVTRRHGIEPLITFTTLSDKLVDSTVPLIFERDQPAAVKAATDCYYDLLHTGKGKGFFPYRVGIGTMPTLVGMQDRAIAFHERIRQTFDPADVLAPGRYR